ncbi:MULTISPECIES: CvpA family protein [unclassified Oceanobacter]|jgi:membrane protein required for colicin V production|uniref:CvpA family protein n=1 Tax=unclassified Oceanobacter TaxID=2620260 RepID=UPI0026E352C2|nr:MULTISPECIES: CvpA family protein [unclassified Oceanobacter]MDO6683465.1 CvpA family protein [Oceanobacter sp. 5_MG-2023]MDP2507063.1 CvpA family protein [Oceanobacter sp. 3_MG-2023]MDP2548821.1 CvpA family protein [Oceanobacter sp. 4_MG-2023]MDP2609584.1 CvpA family protein [Oceanobacter sp. 1_MG-2023]MDP2612667.1 CvpA family protein [Oceanobacter sp. 2_MG-2023]
MAVVDWVILAVLGISSLISLKRGFVREALSLAVWIGAFVVARMFSGNLATLLTDYIETNSLRWIAAFVVLFLGTLAIGAMVNHLIVEVVRLTGLSGTDRILGMVFGCIRGLVVLVAIVYGLQLTMVPKDPWWQQSMFIPHLEVLADWARNTLPGAANRVMSSIPSDF